MSKKLTLASYRKRKERTHSTEDIVQGFDDFMKSPDVPAATQPQDGLTFLPPMPKKAKIPTHPEIDLTTEPDTATEQPLPAPPPSVLPPRPPTTSNSISNAPGQMSNTNSLRNFLHHARSKLDSSISSPPITTQGYTRSVANDNQIRAPIKSQRHSLQSDNRDHQTRAPTKSKSLQLSSLMSRTERSFAPSMGSSLPPIQNRPPSVSMPSPAKRTSLGNSRSDIKKPPYGPMRPLGSLLADAYSPSGCHSSPMKPKASSSGQSSRDGGRRGNGRQRNSLGDKKTEPVVVIDVDEGEQAHDNSRHQITPSEASRESRKALLGASERVSKSLNMSKKAIAIASYRKRKQERTHSTEDIVQGFHDFMKSPDVPAATQPQDGVTFLPPMPKKAKIPTHPEIDLTTEPDTATEQPLPAPSPGLLPPRPPTTSNSISNVPRKMSDTHYFTDYLHQARNQFDSSVSSPPITTPRSVANDNLMRAPIKSQRHPQHDRDHQTGAAIKNNSLQSSSLKSRTERSFAPSVGRSLPGIQNRPLSVHVHVYL